MASEALTESCFKSPGEEGPLSTTFTRVFLEAVEKYGDKEAFVFCEDNARLTFNELKAKADKFGAGLLALGLKRGDRLVIWAPCCLEWIVAMYACTRTGIVYTGLNSAYPPSEAAVILEKINPRCIMTGARLKHGDAYSVLCEICPELKTCEGQVKSERYPELGYVVMPTTKDLNGVTNLKSIFSLGGEKEVAQIQALENDIRPTDPLTVQLTSGTTGTPKAVVLSHQHMVNTCHFVGKRFTFGDSEQEHRLCMPGLMFRCAIMMLGGLNSVMNGLTAVIPSKIPDPEKTLQAIANERCTCLFGNPPMMAGLLKCTGYETYDLTSLTAAILGGTACPLNLMKLVVNKFSLKHVTVGLPMTEIGGIALATSSTSNLEDRCNTIGYPLDNLEVKVVDKEGAVVPVNTPGELCVRGFATPLGYCDGGATKPVLDGERWFNTGDMVTMDTRGYVSTIGRKKDVIVKGIDLIYPKVIEDRLSGNPAIGFVEVVGVPPEADDQKVCACVIRKGDLTESEVRDFCKEAGVPVPDFVCFVEEFPRTLTMKVRKNILAKEMAAKLGL